MREPRWLHRVRRLQAIAQNGLAYTEGTFDRERYLELRRIAAEMAADAAGLPAGTVEGLFAEEHGYATPKVDVRGVVFRAGRILLVREREDGRWALPGGWADVGESPSEAVVKEVREESGFRTRATKLLAVLDRGRHDHPSLIWSVYKMFIRCDPVGGGAAAGLETDGVGFFAEGALPPLSTDRNSPAQIRRMFEHLRRPGRPTDFD